MRCEELFKERSLWQKNAFDRIKASLLTARDNAFLQYDGMQESYLVVVYGPSQIGKTSLILKLIGIRDDGDCFQKVSQTLRTKEITRGNSSTSTAILYARSDTEQYALAVEDEPGKVSEKLFFGNEKELEAKLIEVRSRVVKNRESARSVLHIDIPRQFFTAKTAAENLYVIDLPGVGSKTEGEAAHVQKLMRRYLPVAQVCLVVCTANTIQSLEVQDGLEPYWRDKPGQYIVAATKAFSLGTVKDYFKKPRQEREKSFYDFVMEKYRTETREYLGRTSKVEVFPVELADSFQKLWESLEEEDRKEMTETRDRILQELRQSIRQREGQRFQTALQRLQEELKTAEKSRLAENGGQLDKKQKEIDAENDIIKRNEKYIDNETTGDKQTDREERLRKIKGLQAAKDMLTGCADWFEIRYKPALNEEIDALIERENLFRTSGGSRYLVDRVSALRQNDSDRKVFAAILDYLREKVSGDDSYLDQYVKILKGAGLPVSYNKDALWQKLEQDINEDFYQAYYPKQSLFHREKVWLEDVRKLNGEIVEKVAKALLEYETKWLGELEEVLRNEERLEWQGQQLLAGKRKKADAAKARKSTLEAQKAVLEKAREHIIEEIRQDRENLEDYRRIAKEAYTEQYAGIVRRIRQTPDTAEKTKLVLLLGLLEEDYKTTMGGCQGEISA